MHHVGLHTVNVHLLNRNNHGLGIVSNGKLEIGK